VNVTPDRQPARWPVLVVIGLFVVITAVFVVAFVTATESEMAAPPEIMPELSADTYQEVVTALLQDADADNGARLVEQYGCVACHRLGVATHVAPAFEGIAERSAIRRPPLTAAAYIYESITNPAAYVVEDYQPAMPQNYPDRLSDQELGNMLAYLLTPGAN